MFIGTFLFFVAFSVIVGVIANSRGRSGFGWFFLSVIITPILTLVLVMCLPVIEKDEDNETFKSGRYRSKLLRED